MIYVADTIPVKIQSQLNPCLGRWPGHDLCQNTIPTIFVEWCTWAIWFQLNPISGRLPPFSQENVFASLVSMQHLAFVSIIGANYRREKMTVWQELSELFQLFELFSLEVFFSWELISETPFIDQREEIFVLPFIDQQEKLARQKIAKWQESILRWKTERQFQCCQNCDSLLMN